MRLRFWHEVWKEGSASFHLSRPHRELVTFFSDVSAKKSSRKVLVPLCGKSLDLLWLRKKGQEVVGIELSPIACRAFFTENKIPYRTRKAGKHLVFLAKGITLWCGDLFKMPKEVWSGCEVLYDRAAIIALPPAMRKKYVRHILRHFIDGRNILLITNEYPQAEADGPPFSVPQREIRALYGKAFSVKRVDRHHDARLSYIGKFTYTEVTECAYVLKRRVSSAKKK